MELNGNGAENCQYIGASLSHLDTGFIQEGGQNQHQRNEEDTLSGNSQEGGWDGFTDGLEHHIADDDPALDPEGHTLKPEGHGAEGDDRRIIPEEGNQFGCKDISGNADK